VFTFIIIAFTLFIAFLNKRPLFWHVFETFFYSPRDFNVLVMFKVFFMVFMGLM